MQTPKKSTVEHQSITARLHFNQGLCVGHPRSAGSHAHPLSPLRISAWSAERDTVYLQECRLTLVAGIGNRMDCDFMGLCPHLNCFNFVSVSIMLMQYQQMHTNATFFFMFCHGVGSPSVQSFTDKLLLKKILYVPFCIAVACHSALYIVFTLARGLD